MSWLKYACLLAPKYEGVDGLAWAPDGHLLYTAYVGDAQSIWEMDGEGENRRQLTNNVSDFVDRQMSVTADNHYIVFQSNRSGSVQIWRANRDGSNLRHLVIIPFAGGEPEKTFALPQRPGPNLARRMCWTPDGKAIIYRDTLEAGLWRQRLDEEKPQLVKSFEGVQSPQLTWSFNGKGLAYTRSANMQEILLLQNAR
jgi:sugar lactone lactonase YvrE